MAGNKPPREQTPAAGSGHLFTFTPESPGSLKLHLLMYRIDAEAQVVIEMEARAEFTVE